MIEENEKELWGRMNRYNRNVRSEIAENFVSFLVVRNDYGFGNAANVVSGSGERSNIYKQNLCTRRSGGCQERNFAVHWRPELGDTR
jgi:hypothetical protein